MNGEMYQICSIAVASRKAIQSNSEIRYISEKYTHSITFAFLPEKKLFGMKQYIAPDVPAWFQYLRKKGLQDIKFLCPSAVEDIRVLGFVNTTQSSLVCFFKNNKVTYFTPNWKFDPERKQWDVRYTEYDLPNPPPGKPSFENNRDFLRKALSDIQDLAVKIDREFFASIFADAISILESDDEKAMGETNANFQGMPRENLRLFQAANCADVFGAMGSWNDSPAYMAQDKGLDKEYKELSAELLKNIRLALLFAVNEW